jgi:hypothetical protein
VQVLLSNDTRPVAGADGPDAVWVVDQEVSGVFADFQYVGMGATLVYGSDVWRRS